MSLVAHFRGDSYRRIWARVLLVSTTLFALLIARSRPPDIPRIASVQSVISAISHQDQRPRFAQHLSQWSTPTSCFLPLPPAAGARHLARTLHLFSTIQIKGIHYNRPPPIS
jgi:hypothetical protein